MLPTMHIAIIGKAFSELITYLDNNGHTYTVIRDATKTPRNPKDNTLYCDFSDQNNLIEIVRELHNNSPLTGLLTFFEQYIVFTAVIADELGFPSLSVDSAIACTNKLVMRSRFQQSEKKISPDFCMVGNINELKNFAANHTFPLILKPANLAKSLLVTKNNSMDELVANYQDTLSMIERVYEKYAPHNERLLILEEFMEGSIHSVDAFVDKNGTCFVIDGIVDYQTGYDIGFDDNFHYSRIIPSSLDNETQKKITEVAELGTKALNMTSSAAHIEIIVTKEGPMIVEIGARNGGYRERMHRLANGLDLYGNLIKVATNTGEVDIIKKSNKWCAVLELFPETNGTFQSVENIKKVKLLESVNYVSVKYKPGDEAGKSSKGFKAACVIALVHEDENIFQDDLKFIRSDVKVIVKR
jgi:phosphoribosylamine-glycine ligase